MNYDNEKDCTIFYLKFIQAMMCQTDLDDFLKEADELGIHYTSLPVLEMMRDLVKAYSNGYSLPKEIKDNIFSYLQRARYVQEEESLENHAKRFSLCNDIIRVLHDSMRSPEYPFYVSFIRRFYPNPIKSLIMQLRSITDPEEGKEIVRTFAATEYYILYSHSSLLSDEEFMGVGANFLLNGAYLMCIENLLKQYPELGESPLFLERTSKILDYNDALMDEYQGKPNSDADCIFYW